MKLQGPSGSFFYFAQCGIIKLLEIFGTDGTFSQNRCYTKYFY